ncbi:MAG: hypothetical protein ACO2ON_03885 [Candidatus Nanopusillus sp.]
MDQLNVTAIGTELINLTDTIVKLITFKDIYSYILLEILVIAFYIAMESNRVESIKTLVMGIMIIMWIFLIAILALNSIGYINITGPQLYTFFMMPTVLVTVIALMLPLLSYYKGSGGSDFQRPPSL